MARLAARVTVDDDRCDNLENDGLYSTEYAHFTRADGRALHTRVHGTLHTGLGSGHTRVAHTDRVAHAQKEVKFAFSRVNFFICD